MASKRKRENSDEADSGDESNLSYPDDQRTLKAAKDKKCPFCQAPFTSSSLGRHLDLYIRRVNPKRPDGIHNVDEIRVMRGDITRRQPRGSGPAARAGSVKERSEQDIASESAEHERQEYMSRQLPRPTHHINGMDWRTTGVINDVRPPPSITKSTDGINGRAGPQLPPLGTHSPMSRPHDEALEEQIENCRAAELALDEVLESVAAARRQQQGGEMHDGIDLCSLSFPALCLALLPPPRTLFSTTPFPDAESWDMKPPSERERRQIEAVMERKRLSRRVFSHLEIAFVQWSMLDEHHRGANWILEVLRSFSSAKAAMNGLNSSLSLARQRIEHLESEYEYLSRCQLPRERMLNLPSTLPISKSSLEYLDPRLPSAAALLDKWKTTVRTVPQSRKMPSSALSMMNYADSAIKSQDPSQSRQPGTMNLSTDMVMNGSVFGVEGPMSRIDQHQRPVQDTSAYEKSNGRMLVSKMVDHG